ncbi:hypothetical protein [Variovorax sp. YR216]|uniref:hypothetical protein n=1 Tax=Variovorax sp. YR216 TaxID=1882828 RepID=UPI000898A5E8|nr:hypothetical protein [Variovorax sp. YR216]SEA17158.1 hypothetical protein SAMN05444680_101767 [Variovorax sp. YR216]
MLNTALARVHMVMAALYFVVCAGIVLKVLHTGGKAQMEAVIILTLIFALPVGLHALAFAGVRQGKSWARGLSRAVGILLLLSIPIGTIIGIFILRRTRGADWEAGATGTSPPARS